MQKISKFYTLFTRIPLLVVGDSEIFADKLWAVDLLEHFEYIENLNLCCPLVKVDSVPEGYVRISKLDRSNIFPVKEDKGWLSVALNFVPNFLAVMKAARRTEIAHGGAAGWSFPLAYYLYPLKPLLSFKLVFVMESSFWMAPAQGPVTMRQRIAHAANVFFVKRMMRQAEARIFTQTAYRDWCFPEKAERCLVNEAVWINPEDMIEPQSLPPRLAGRTGPLRLIFPGRLVAEKGVETVLKAIALAERRFIESGRLNALAVDIVGTGTMEPAIREFIANHPGNAVGVRLLPPVTYGWAFFALLREYDAGIVANLFEEQPRIIYDLFSQGVPCLASRTSGIEHIVRESEDTLLFPPGDAQALAEQFIAIADMRDQLASMGAIALENMTGKTHRGMHEKRAEFLASVLGAFD